MLSCYFLPQLPVPAKENKYEPRHQIWWGILTNPLEGKYNSLSLKYTHTHTLHYDIHVCNTAGAIRKIFTGSCWNVLIQVNGKRGGGAESNAYERKNMEAHERGGKGTKKNSGNRILLNRQGGSEREER